MNWNWLASLARGGRFDSCVFGGVRYCYRPIRGHYQTRRLALATMHHPTTLRGTEEKPIPVLNSEAVAELLTDGVSTE